MSKTHQELGNELDFFMFHEFSPGSCFFLPHGKKILRKLEDYFRYQYRLRGYDEVDTPNIASSELWKISGHWDHYRENMFTFDIKDKNEKDEECKYTFALKPMNCSYHCLIYKAKSKSYRDLPIRIADFGVLHRNEFSGALSGLLRVRKFRQDDAHIFCRPDQILTEVKGCLDFIISTYTKFGFEYKIAISTRPDKYMGDMKLWERAEKNLKNALDVLGIKYYVKDKDGAFYGPKIDISVKDSLKREHQCGTIQLDFQLPERFDLKYKTEDSEERPIIIHRAILGSFERMFAILTEHYQGRFPLWLSPRQILITPVSEEAEEYAKTIHKELFELGYDIDLDLSNDRVPKKVRSAEMLKYNYILIVGKREMGTVTKDVCVRRGKKLETLYLKDFIKELKESF